MKLARQPPRREQELACRSESAWLGLAGWVFHHIRDEVAEEIGNERSILNRVCS
jgi:hypothetical protein